MKPLFYNQFVGGVTVRDIQENMAKVSAGGSGCIVLLVMEAINRYISRVVEWKVIGSLHFLLSLMN